MIEITQEQLEKILYHIDDTMGFYRWGGEYNKMAKLVNELPLETIDLTKFPHIKRAIEYKNFYQE